MSNERIDKDLGLHVDWSHNEVFGPLVEEFPSLIAELKRCYEEIAMLKSQYQSCQESLMDQTNWSVRLVEAIDSGKMSEIKRVRNS